MNGKQIIKYLEDWAPREISWDKDNAGLQVGNPDKKIKNIMLSLDLSDEVIGQAIKKNCNFIITHHPILFYPVINIDVAHNKTAMMIEKLIKNDITLYSSHTNLDFTKDGVSFQLAKRLKLNNIRFLKNLTSNQVKLSVFVPEKFVEKVADAIHSAGGGIIGEYSNCSFRTEGTGTFKGSDKSSPAIGKKGVRESVDEIKLEVLIDEWKLKSVINAMKKAHPYEEVAYDIYPLKNSNANYGIGAIGELKNNMSSDDFLGFAASKLKTKNLRFTHGKKVKVKTVAVCGGSCGELIDEAVRQNADAFITADIKYHLFQDAQGKILLVDAGHYETELPVLDEIQRRIKLLLNKNKKINVIKFKGLTNPVVFYNKKGAN